MFDVRRAVQGGGQGVHLPLLPPGHHQHLQGEGEEGEETAGDLSQQWNLQQERSHYPQPSGVLTKAGLNNYIY